MNPFALLRNVRSSFKVCSSWYDCFTRMLWLYHDKALVRLFKASDSQQISFAYPTPIKDIRVLVRDNHGSDAFIFSEVFDHRYYDFALPFSPKTILDLGANAGFATIFFARKYPTTEIACVEPMPDNIKLLRKNFELNKIEARIFPAAVAVEDGFIQMEIAELDYEHKVAGIDFGKTQPGKTITVQAISVPTIMKELKWERIGLLKVDIEGYEGILLKEHCDWLSFIDAICIECHEGYGETDLQMLAKDYSFNRPQQLEGVWLLARE